MALRQRIRALRKTLAGAGVPMPRDMAGLTLDLAYGALRQALGAALGRHGGTLATHDPDGHVLIIGKISQKG